MPGAPWQPWLLQPCGTEAAARRHRRHGELPLDEACRQAENHAGRSRKLARAYGPKVVPMRRPSRG